MTPARLKKAPGRCGRPTRERDTMNKISPASTAHGHTVRASVRESRDDGAAIQTSQIGIGRRFTTWKTRAGSIVRS
jgi:hypothetical protein